MPVRHRKTQVFFHGFPGNYLFCVIPAVCKWIVGFRALVRDFPDPGEVFAVSNYSISHILFNSVICSERSKSGVAHPNAFSMFDTAFRSPCSAAVRWLLMALFD